MRTLVIYDTWFGNTERVARAIAEGVSGVSDVEVVSSALVADALALPPDLLLVGGPTQRRRMSPGLSDLLESIPRRSLRGVPAATFDTRYRMTRLLSGSAAVAAAHRLRRAGCRLVAEPESFFIERDRLPGGGRRGHEDEHLEDGELARARAWGEGLAASNGAPSSADAP